MMKKLYQPIATGVITSLLLTILTVVPAAAQSTQGTDQGATQSQSQSTNPCAQAAIGTGADTAAEPITNCWLSIAPGQKQWYKFHVGARSNTGDENNNKDNANGIDDSDAAIAELVMDTPGCITFEIWTLARLNAPPPVGSDASREEKRKDKEVARGPVGVGSPEFAIVKDDSSSDNTNSSCANKGDSSACTDKNRNLARLLWRGGSTVSENFYIVIRNVRTDFACSYRLSVAGTTVSFPAATNPSNNAPATDAGNTSDNSSNGSNG